MAVETTIEVINTIFDNMAHWYDLPDGGVIIYVPGNHSVYYNEVFDPYVNENGESYTN